MNPETVRIALKAIEDSAGDDERAHGMEDDLYHEFVAWVAEVGPKRLSTLAKMILESKKMDFSRWCA